MITYQSKLLEWLQYTLVGTSSDEVYRLILLKEDLSQHEEVIQELKQYVQDAHDDARRHFRDLAGCTLNPFEVLAKDDPVKDYPQILHLSTLKGYFGEIFAAIIAENFSPCEVSNWEVPAFLFRIHAVAFQQLEALSQTGDEAKEIPGRTGDDLLAFQRDSSGEIVRILYCEAKCTADHDSGMISKAYEKVSKSVPVDFLQYIDVIRDSNNPSAGQWVDAIRRARSRKIYERYDLVSYVCGRHPKRNSVWLPTTKPHRNYIETRRLEAVETHLYDVDSLVGVSISKREKCTLSR